MPVIISLFVLSLLSIWIAQPTPCSLPPQLSPGNSARITPGLPSNLRAEPSASSELIIQVSANAIVEVIDGPTCAEDMNWWQVGYETYTGWLAEGLDEEYFVFPLGMTANPDLQSPIALTVENHLVNTDYTLGQSLVIVPGENGFAAALANADESVLRIWDTSGEPIQTISLDHYNGLPFTIALTDDASQIVTGGELGAVGIEIWDVASGDKVSPLKDYTVAMDVNGDLLAYIDVLDLVIYNLETGAEQSRVPRAGLYHVTDVQFSDDGQRLLLTDSRGFATVWDMTGAAAERIQTINADDESITFSSAQLFGGQVVTLHCLESGESSGNCRRFEITFWDILTGQRTFTIEQRSEPEAYGPIYLAIEAARGVLAAGTSSRIWLYNMVTGETLVEEELPGREMVFLDGRIIALDSRSDIYIMTPELSA